MAVKAINPVKDKYGLEAVIATAKMNVGRYVNVPAYSNTEVRARDAKKAFRSRKSLVGSDYSVRVDDGKVVMFRINS